MRATQATEDDVADENWGAMERHAYNAADAGKVLAEVAPCRELSGTLIILYSCPVCM